ncbi:penicillin-binding protein 2 [Rhodohalobacter barkolensis]|uniref:Penicillin-binding protein 2 n=1 Tax=Rhodohalobacter barkolensis TaxID=2053187 RepID=A0A2N0VIG0_9BACT|nr:penicillin-binding protein 2 [Rhodohalobacter barkolensis]PKD43954.1 penicillin-binding protein 2 [Rhodohalobacter barkolensis]
MGRRRKPEQVKASIRILQGVIIIGLLVLFIRIFQLQILDHEKYSPLSMQNSLRMEMVHPARGLILDRNGTILVDNQPIYSITITPANFDMGKIPLLSDMLGLDEQVILERIQIAQQYSWQRTSRLFTEVPFEVFSIIQENLWQLPGIGHQVDSKRNFHPDLKASHIFGYLREASREEYEQSDYIRLGDKIGKSGIEMVYEDHLRGELGNEYIKVNAYGQALGSFNNGELDSPPQEGGNLITTIDTELQILAEQLMENKTGALVAMDPQTGAILSMVSSPQYDVSRLAGRMDMDYWRSINTDPKTPLFNRAISARQPPGSTFKPFMALVGLHMGLFNERTVLTSPGYYRRGRNYGDLADPGDYDIEKSIAESSNYFFYWMMDRVASNGQLNTWSNLIQDFGIGPLNGIDLPSERTGIVPDSTYLNQTFGVRRWSIGDIINLGIGQGLVSASPLQMAVAVSSIANGGYRVQPHIVNRIQYSENDVRYTDPEKNKIDWLREDHLNIVKKGMRRVITEGGGRFYTNIPDIEVAGKTGTAQNPHGANHGWFISFAPMDDPKIAIAVLTENSGFGSISAAPVAGLLIEKYINGEISPQRNWILDYVLNFQPRTEQPVEEVEEDAQL